MALRIALTLMTLSTIRCAFAMSRLAEVMLSDVSPRRRLTNATALSLFLG